MCLGLLCAGCSGSNKGTGPDETTTVSLTRVSGNGQQGVPNSVASDSLVVLAARTGEGAVPGRVVEFAVASGDARVEPESALSDSQGHARTRVHLGSASGEVKIAVTTVGAADTVEFTLTTARRVTPPTVRITQIPGPAEELREGETVTLGGQAVEGDGTQVPSDSLVWASSIDGPLGRGNHLQVLLSAGEHSITLSATDAEGDRASAEQQLTVLPKFASWSRYPAIVGSMDTPDFAGDVHVSGSYAYVADYLSHLLVIDVSDPAGPVVAGSTEALHGAGGVCVTDGYAFVAGLAGGVYVMDINDPANPAIAGSVCTPELATGVHVSGSHAYVADGASGLH